jgi:hypothetical protein
LQESAGRAAEDVVRELYEQVFGPPPSDDDGKDNEGGGDPEGEAVARQERAAR